jgi:hypothetical protein
MQRHGGLKPVVAEERFEGWKVEKALQGGIQKTSEAGVEAFDRGMCNSELHGPLLALGFGFGTLVFGFGATEPGPALS